MHGAAAAVTVGLLAWTCALLLSESDGREERSPLFGPVSPKVPAVNESASSLHEIGERASISTTAFAGKDEGAETGQAILVVDPAGRPVAGALVWIRPARTPSGAGVFVRLVAHGRADAHGRYRWESLSGPPFQVDAILGDLRGQVTVDEGPSAGSQDLPAGVLARVRILPALRRVACLTGRVVTAQGSPARGQTFVLQRSSQPPESPPVFFAPRRRSSHLRTGPEGRFYVKVPMETGGVLELHLPGATRRLLRRFGDDSTALLPLVSKPYPAVPERDTHDLGDLKLPDLPLLVAGRVVDGTGRGCASLSLEVRVMTTAERERLARVGWQGGPGSGDIIACTSTGPDGSFLLYHQPWSSGAYTIGGSGPWGSG